MFRSVPRCFRHILLCCVVCIFLLLFCFTFKLNYVLSKFSSTTELITEKIQMERRILIKDKCRDNKLKLRKTSWPVNFKIEDRHRIVYCDVPKVASTNMKRLMLILSGVVNTDNLTSIPRLTVHENSQMRKLDAHGLADITDFGVANYTKLIFVRHPYERLVSAYQDKLASGNIFYQEEIGREIIGKYRKQPSQLSLKKGHDVTFPEFVTYIIDQWKEGRTQLDVHWRPVIDLCLPCSMEYDFVGKFESLIQDVNFFLQKLNKSDLSELFALSKPPYKTTMSIWKQYFQTINCHQLSDLNCMFGDDFRLFGYPLYSSIPCMFNTGEVEN